MRGKAAQMNVSRITVRTVSTIAAGALALVGLTACTGVNDTPEKTSDPGVVETTAGETTESPAAMPVAEIIVEDVWTDDEGYTMALVLNEGTVTVEDSLLDSAPGEVEMEVLVDVAMTVTNLTEGRNLPWQSVYAKAVPLYRSASIVCEADDLHVGYGAFNVYSYPFYNVPQVAEGTYDEPYVPETGWCTFDTVSVDLNGFDVPADESVAMRVGGGYGTDQHDWNSLTLPEDLFEEFVETVESPDGWALIREEGEPYQDEWTCVYDEKVITTSVDIDC